MLVDGYLIIILGFAFVFSLSLNLAGSIIADIKLIIRLRVTVCTATATVRIHQVVGHRHRWSVVPRCRMKHVFFDIVGDTFDLAA